MDFYEQLKELCANEGVSVSKVEKDLGFSNGSLAKGTPSASRLFKVAQYFDLPMEYFLVGDDWQDKYFHYYKKISKPLWRASAGQGAYNGETSSETIETDDDGYEYAKVIGDSMYPELRSGDIVKIKPQSETTPHDFTLVKVDGEHATIKYVEIVENGVWLRALNKDVFEDKFFTIQEVMTLPVTIIGKVVELQRNF